jgi:hypothetical protein
MVRHRSIHAAGVLCAVGIAMLLIVMPSRAARAEPSPVPIAIADFEYTDTSGEVQDRAEQHKALLEAFMAAMRGDLGKSGKHRVVLLDCRDDSCSSGRSDPSELSEGARRAGARLLLFAGVHKVSTLIQKARIEGIDVEKDRLVYDRAFSFRGDDEDAWRHAEAFVVRDLDQQDFSR